MSSYVQLLDGSTEWPAGIGDGFGLQIGFANTNLASNSNAGLATIGIDLAGGTTYTDWISNVICGPTSNVEDGYTQYYFPIRIPNGASLGIKAQGGSATPPANPDCQFKIFCKPTRPECIRVGSFVRTYGAVTATSEGTAVTPGGVSEGTYVELGTLADEIWGWEFGVTCTAAAIGAAVSHTDIAVGDATNKIRVIRNHVTTHGTSEVMAKLMTAFQFGEGPNGSKVYGRMQMEGTQTGCSLIAYGIGG
ncbi:MAG: hypothetical protein ABL886_00465 [Rhodoglobus sp.]